MGDAVLAARILLAAVFVVAGVGKLLDLPGSRRALVGFGVPGRLAQPGGVLLPIVEIATAVALLVQPAARWGAAAALLLLVAFIAGIANALAQGRTPDCNCFGNLHSAPAGRKQIVRNVVLAGIAGFILVAGPGSSIREWISGKSNLVAVLLGLAILALLALCLHLWQQRRHLRESLTAARTIVDALPPGLRVGSLAPSFRARDLNGESFSLEDLCSRGKPIALIFGAPGCGPCSVLVPEVLRWQEALGHGLTIAAVGIGTYARFEEAQSRSGDSLQEVYERDPELAREADELNLVLTSYRLRATPSAVIVTAEGTIATATVDGRPAIRALIHLAVTRRGTPGFAASLPVTAAQP